MNITIINEQYLYKVFTLVWFSFVLQCRMISDVYHEFQHEQGNLRVLEVETSPVAPLTRKTATHQDEQLRAQGMAQIPNTNRKGRPKKKQSTNTKTSSKAKVSNLSKKKSTKKTKSTKKNKSTTTTTTSNALNTTKSTKTSKKNNKITCNRPDMCNMLCYIIDCSCCYLENFSCFFSIFIVFSLLSDMTKCHITQQLYFF